MEARERKTRALTSDASFRFHLALVANGSLTEQSFEKQQEAAKERYFDLLGTYRPWEGKSYVDRKGKEFIDSRQAYIDVFGVDPLDPEYQKWEAQRIEDMQAGKFDVVDEAQQQEEAIFKRLLARDAKKGK